MINYASEEGRKHYVEQLSQGPINKKEIIRFEAIESFIGKGDRICRTIRKSRYTA